MPKVVNRVVHMPKANEKNQLIDEIIKIGKSSIIGSNTIIEKKLISSF